MPSLHSNLARTSAPVVSTDAEDLVLVDGQDRELGFLDKAACHDGKGVLHRAFSVFLFNDRGEVLIQKRAASKRLWPSYWANSCCSHPRRGEALEQAVRRRLGEELGVRAQQVRGLAFLYKFEYQAAFGAAGSEHELCSVFRAQLAGAPMVNTTEIDDWAWVAPSALTRRLEQRPGDFAPWLHLEWPHLLADEGTRSRKRK